MKNMLAKRLLILAHSDIHANEAVETRLGVADTELLSNNNKTPALLLSKAIRLLKRMSTLMQELSRTALINFVSMNYLQRDISWMAMVRLFPFVRILRAKIRIAVGSATKRRLPGRKLPHYSSNSQRLSTLWMCQTVLDSLFHTCL